MESQTLTNNSIKEQEKETKYGASKTFTKGLVSKSLSLLQTLFTYTILVFVSVTVLIVNSGFREKLESLALSLDSAIEELEEGAFRQLQKMCSSLARDFRHVGFYVMAAALSFCHGGPALFLCVVGVKFCLKYVREIIAEIPGEEGGEGGEGGGGGYHEEREESDKDAFLVI